MARKTEPADTSNFDDDTTDTDQDNGGGEDDRGDNLDDDDEDEEEEDGDDDTDGGDDDSEDDEEEEDEDRGDDAGDGDDEPDADTLKDLAEDTDGSDGKAPKTVSYTRFREVNERAQRLEAALIASAGGKAAPAAGNQQQEQQAPAFDLKAKLKERNAAMIEGDEDKALALDIEIEDHRTAVATANARNTMSAERAQERLDAAAQKVLKKYPDLKSDPELIADVAAVRDRLAAKGVPAHEALIQAADRLLAGRSPAKEARAKAGAEGGGKKGGKVEKSQKEVAALIARAGRASRQPPSLRNAGTPNKERIDASKLNIAEMDEDDYEKLPESVKKRLRGDGVASN